MTAAAAEKKIRNEQTSLLSLSDGTEYRGITANIKAADLPDESLSEFSDAPFEFQSKALLLWQDTQKIYVHACTANRFSENYLTFCGQLEKNIKQLGSFCLTKAVLEQQGMSFPELSQMSVKELVGMVSFHLRKAHAAMEGIYRDNHILGMTYLNWEFRWVGLDNRLRATEVRIQDIKEGKINTVSMLKQAETFKGGERTNDKAPSDTVESLPAVPKVLPIKGSMARMMLGMEKEAEKQAEMVRKEKERLLRLAKRYEQRVPGGFQPPKPFGPSKEDMAMINRANAAYYRKKAEELDKPEPEPEPEALPPGVLTEAEARQVLLDDAVKRNDQEAIKAIPGEDTDTLHERWLKYTARVEREAMLSRSGPSKDVRKALREKRKKRK